MQTSQRFPGMLLESAKKIFVVASKIQKTVHDLVFLIPMQLIRLWVLAHRDKKLNLFLEYTFAITSSLKSQELLMQARDTQLPAKTGGFQAGNP